MVYNAIDIARYVIYREFSLGHSVSNLKLQKVLYFIQAQFLVFRNQPCFREDIVAWPFGPVVLEVYREYKIYGSSIFPCNLKIKCPYILVEDMELIDGILDLVREYSSTYLTEITLRQEPWIKSYDCDGDKVISHKLIKKFFSED